MKGTLLKWQISRQKAVYDKLQPSSNIRQDCVHMLEHMNDIYELPQLPNMRQENDNIIMPTQTL